MSKVRLILVIVALTAFLAVPGLASAAAQISMVSPVVSLQRVEVQSYFGFWIGTKEKPAEKGHAPLILAFVFDVMNPNSLPVQMENLKFTVAFEGYDVNTLMYTNPMWIPAGKTNQVRVVGTFSSRAAFLNLLVTSGFKLKAEGKKAPDLVKRWWEGAPDMSYVMEVKGGTAGFIYEGDNELRANFVGQFGGK